MNNKHWKSKYFEKNINESHTYLFRSLEIKQYLQKILKDQGFILHSYKLNFSNSVINLFISIYKTEQANIILKKNKLSKKKVLLIQEEKLIWLKKNLKSYFIKRHLFNNIPTRTKYWKILKFYKIYLLKLNLLQNRKLKSSELNNFSNKILKNLTLFMNNKFDITLTIQEINSVNKISESKQILLKLRKFERLPFFTEGKNFLIPLITQNDAAQLLADFIAVQLRTIKRHNFFFNFLKESLNIVINQKISKIQGVKLIIKGRLNNAARAKHRIITIGKTPLTTINSRISYSQSTAFTSNGTLGIKVWICN